MSDLIDKHLHRETYDGPTMEDQDLLFNQVWQEFIDQDYDSGQAYFFTIRLLTRLANDTGKTSRDLFSQFTTSLKILVAHKELPL